MKTYSVKEASELIGISTRAVQKRCFKDNIRKKSNRYLITDEHIDTWTKERVANELKTLRYAENELHDDVVRRIEDLKNENASLKIEVKELKSNVNKEISVNNEQLDLEVQSLQIENASLKEKLKQYDITDDQRIEVFTNKEYQILETRLQEWYSLQKEIQHQEQLFDVEKKSLNEILEHYKTQFEYQKTQSDKILQMHQKLIDTIEKQSAITIQRNIIEAKDKQIIDSDLKQRK